MFVFKAIFIQTELMLVLGGEKPNGVSLDLKYSFKLAHANRTSQL